MSTTIREVPQKFETSDGREFTDKTEAERHQKLIDAKRVYENARHAFGKAMAETQRTADGELFEYRFTRSYWRLYQEWGKAPHLQRVDLPSYRIDYEDRDGFVLLHMHHGQRGLEITRHPVSELYMSEAKARAALVAAWEKHIAEQTELLEEVRARGGRR